MNGFEVIKVLKENEKTKDIPVIFVTGLNNPKDEELSFSLGAADYINKPFSAPVVKLRVKNQIQIINHSRSIKQLSTTDMLTGVGSRPYMIDTLGTEWRKATSNSRWLGFALFDIDNFQNFNAEYGHIPGDKVLKSVSKLINDKLEGRTGHVARWAGEEFAVVLLDTNLEQIQSFATEIIDMINNHDFVHNGTSFKVTVSAGVNAIVPTETTFHKLDEFISNTTEALNRSKGSDKNQAIPAKNLN